MTTTEKAAALRAAYKAKGWNSRRVGVRAEYFSLGSSVEVTIKDGSVPFGPVDKLAHDMCEKIDRCEITGEILGGGNCYVSTHVSNEARTLKARRYVEAVESGISCLPEGRTSTLQPVGHGYLVGRDEFGRGFDLWKDHKIAAMMPDAVEVAYRMALDMEGGR